MSRWLTALAWDFRLQWRYGFFLVGAIVAATAVGVLLPFPVAAETYSFWLPVFVLGNLTVTTFYFVAGLVMFEKGEGTLEALVVTPLRVEEYLLSKVATLSILAGSETALIIAIVHPGPLHWAPLLAGLGLMSAFYTLIGFLAVIRYDSITDFLMPSVLIVIVVQLPLVDYAGLWQSPVFALWPTRGLLHVVASAGTDVSIGRVTFGAVYAVGWVVALFMMARAAFGRFVVRSEGVH